MAVSRSTKAHLLLVLVTFIWGVTFVVIKDALALVSPLYFNFVRMTLAAVALIPILGKSRFRFDGRTIRAGAIVGALLWLGYEFQTSGLKYTTPSKSAFLTGVSVVLVPVWLALFWGRKVNAWTGAGVLSAFAGLFLLTVPAGGSAMADFASINRGDVLTMGCAVAFAFHIVMLGRFTQVYPFAHIAFLQTVFSALFMGATIPVMEHPWAHWNLQSILAILVTGLLGTAMAFSIQAWAQQFTPPTHTALIFSLEPVFAWITSYVVLHERLGWRATIGAIFILSGVLISELKGSASQ